MVLPAWMVPISHSLPRLLDPVAPCPHPACGTQPIGTGVTLPESWSSMVQLQRLRLGMLKPVTGQVRCMQRVHASHSTNGGTYAHVPCAHACTHTTTHMCVHTGTCTRTQLGAAVSNASLHNRCAAADILEQS
jgi:hypothetical protein